MRRGIRPLRDSQTDSGWVRECRRRRVYRRASPSLFQLSSCCWTYLPPLTGLIISKVTQYVRRRKTSNARHPPPPQEIAEDESRRVGGRVHAVVSRRGWL